MILFNSVFKQALACSLIVVIVFILTTPSKGYVIWFAYDESDLPHTLNMLSPSDLYGGYDEAMATRWNLYADIFNKWTNRLLPIFRDGYNDEVGLLNDSEFNSYFSTSSGWGGAAVTVREWPPYWNGSDIAYDSGTQWTTSETGSGKLFQGTALHELGHTIGLAHNFEAMSVMNYSQPKTIDAHLMPDDVRYLYDTFPNKAKSVTDMGVWAYTSSGYQAYAAATTTPSSVSPGGTIEVDGIYVGNLRNGTQSGAVIKFYLSTNTSISTSDTYIGQVSFSDWGAAIGSTYSNIVFSIPSTVAQGTYYVGMIIYANGSSTDSITYNNTAYLPTPITVSGSGTTTTYIDPSGSCNGNTPCYTTIQSAINAVSSGSVIKVMAGAYAENLDLNSSNNYELQGGWNAAYSSQTSTSSVSSMTFGSSSGTVTVGGMVVQ